MGEHEVSRDRSVRLFHFLSELAQLSTKPARTWKEFETVMWLHEIPQGPEVRRMAWRDGEHQDKSEIWLEIRKPDLPSPPKIPTPLRPWVKDADIRNSGLDEPTLLDKLANPQAKKSGLAKEFGDEPYQYLDQMPEIRQLWQDYVATKWKPWAAENERLRSVQRVYTEMFSLFQKQRQLGEEYELLVGLGLLGWKPPDKPEVHRHVFVARTHLEFDPVKGIISVGPAGEGAKLTVEPDMLDVEQRPQLKEPDFTNMLDQIGDAIWDQQRVSPVLRAWINSFSSTGSFSEDLQPQHLLGEAPKLHLAPALILRKRGGKSIVCMLEEIAQQLLTMSVIPEGIRKLAGSETVSHREERDISGIEEIHFPKPSNQEQRQIVQRLSSTQGLVVQGPPGTGKSHTIANLVCHLLAIGQKVLVTSHTPRALRVLQDKFPKGIEALCVALLDDDRKALRDLEASVDQITRRYEGWNADENQREIGRLEKELEKSRSQQNGLVAKLKSIREAEIYRHPSRFGGYQGTTANIALQLRSTEEALSWIPVPIAENAEPPISNSDAELLLRLLRLREEKAEETKSMLPDPRSILNPRDFWHFVEKESQTEKELEAFEACRKLPGYAVLLGAESQVLQQLAESLLELRNEMSKFMQHKERWVQKAAQDILSQQARMWHELKSETQRYLQIVESSLKGSPLQNVSGPRGRTRVEIKTDAQALVEHLEGGGRLGFWIFRPHVVRKRLYLVRETIIDGKRCDTPGTLRRLIGWIDAMDALDNLKKRWGGLHVVRSTSFDGQISEFGALKEALSGVLDLKPLMDRVKSSIDKLPGLLEPLWHSLENLQLFAEALDSVKIESRLASTREAIQGELTSLIDLARTPRAHPAVKVLAQAGVSRDVELYSSVFRDLESAWDFKEEMKRSDDLLEKLVDSSPALGQELQNSVWDSQWDTRLRIFEQSWNWTRCNCWLEALTDPQEERRIREDLFECTSETERLMEKLVEQKAWGHCFNHLSEKEIRHLVAWRAAMNKVGKGTGKHAEKHRKSARKHMAECRSAIPAWVMPIFRVVENFSPQPELFDVVIVDEASQSGPEALFLYHLGKRVVVVGDDKQISPEPFTDLDVVDRLRHRHISDLEHCEAFGADYSFFDISRIFYPRFVRLKEHFRCMPEIIQYSNNLCYSDQPLIPLRQHGQDRLPPVQVCHVHNGFQQGAGSKVSNPPEAEALVDRIRACVEDKAYDGKTMGVISLLARGQAQLIENRLRETIGPEEMVRRQLICGDSYAFQGDERDVIFLSLVRAPTDGEAVMALTQARDERRFNVAVSRARDQIWLFHTLTLNDLKPTCLRYRLLEYFENPHTSVPPWIDLKELRRSATLRDRDDHRIPKPFDSWFEVDVFLKIADRGYRVIPQFEAAGYYIDLVVEGLRGRMAVECDGDSFHGPEKFADDMAREKELERCGWRFWRVRGSTFYRNSESALESLWQTLEQADIYPSSVAKDTSENTRNVDSRPRAKETGAQRNQWRNG